MSELVAMLAAVLLMKLTAMVIGYKIVRLGFDALVRGIKGEFDFGGKIQNQAELKLISASPGLFFVLLGSAVIIWAIAVDKPIKFESQQSPPLVQSVTQPENMEDKK